MALKIRDGISCNLILGRDHRGGFLRDIFERVPQLDAQVLDVAPLSFLHRLTRQLDVVHRQLGLVEQPLDHKHGA